MTRITSNPVVIAKSIDNLSFFQRKNGLFILFFLLILIDHKSRSLETSEHAETNGDNISEKIDSLFLHIMHFFRTDWLYHPHGSVNSWVELDLHQRRHIANEFTVRVPINKQLGHQPRKNQL